jgi:two-component system response regulator RegX3
MAAEAFLIVSASKRRAEWLRASLARGGCDRGIITPDRHAISRARDSGVSLMLVDADDPGGRGVQLIRAIRDHGHPVAILAITRGTNASAAIDALDSGADGCTSDTCTHRELAARLRAVTRWRNVHADTGSRHWEIGGARIDPTSPIVDRREGHVSLTPSEHAVLRALLRRRGRVVSTPELVVAASEAGARPTGNGVKVLVHRLRCKLEDTPQDPRHIITIRARGYLIPA